MKKKILFITFSVLAMALFTPNVYAQECTETQEAKIGDTCYDKLSTAMQNAQENDTITILKDIDSTDPWVGFTAKSITIDFNKHTLTLKSGTMGLLIYGKTLLKNGNIVSEAPKATQIPTALMIRGGNATLDGMNVTGKNGAAITLYEKTASLTVNSNSVVTGEGENATIVGYGEGTNHVVNVYGTVKHTKSYSGINGGKECSTFNVNVYEGATIEGGENGGAGILQLTEGTINVYGGKVTGWSGIVMTKGNLNVTGGEVEGTGNGIPTSSSSASGSVKDNGAAVYVATPEDEINIEITAGTFTSTYASAISAPNDNEKLTLSIAGGTFTGNEEKGAIDVSGKEEFISGGTFNTDVSKYLLSGTVQDENGNVVVPTQEEEKNPDTADTNIYGLLTIILVSGLGLGYVVRKRMN